MVTYGKNVSRAACSEEVGMPCIPVDRPDDPRVAEYRDVREAILMRERGLFVAEGRLVVTRLIRARGYAIRSMLLSRTACEALAPVLAEVASEVPIYVCDSEAFSLVAGFDLHRGCLALVQRPRPLALSVLLGAAHLLIMLEAVGNADNVGGVFRNAAAFGADAVLLSPTTCDPLYRKAIRTSMAATLQVPFCRAEPWPDILGPVGARFTIAALTPRAPAMTIDEFVAAGVPDRLVLLIGNEGAGLSAAAEAYASCRVRIPIRSDIDSLNLAVAVGVALSRVGYRVASDDSVPHTVVGRVGGSCHKAVQEIGLDDHTAGAQHREELNRER
jgi:tRNA G18 (ribose-2'-O)-methylase SpoU